MWEGYSKFYFMFKMFLVRYYRKMFKRFPNYKFIFWPFTSQFNRTTLQRVYTFKNKKEKGKVKWLVWGLMIYSTLNYSLTSLIQ